VLHPAALRYVGPEVARDDSELRLILAIHRRGLAVARGWLDSDFEGLSQAEAVLLTNLSQPSVSTLAKGLRARGLLLPDSDGMVLDPRAGIAFGIDIGFRQVRVALSDLHGQVIDLESLDTPFPTALGENASKSLDWMEQQLRELEQRALKEAPRAHVIGVGISIAGPVDRETGKLQRAWDTGGDWQFLSAAAELKQRLGWRDTDFITDRDANASAAAEAIWRAGGGTVDVPDILYCKWAEGGVTASLTFDHQIYHGSTGIAGEITHSVVPIDQAEITRADNVCLEDWFKKRICARCGRSRCLSEVTSLAALRAYLGDETLGAEEIVKRANAYDPTKRDRKSPEYHAHHALEAAALCVGRVLRALIDTFNPSLVIVGGKIGANAFPVISGALNAGIAEYGLTPAIQAADLSRGSEALTGKTSVRGAVALALIQAAPRRLQTLARHDEAEASGNGAKAVGAV
jgi:predicted NBD/HSP70 family sugar kinase